MTQAQAKHSKLHVVDTPNPSSARKWNTLKRRNTHLRAPYRIFPSSQRAASTAVGRHGQPCLSRDVKTQTQGQCVCACVQTSVMTAVMAASKSRSPSPGSRCRRHCCQTWLAATAAVGMLVLLLVPVSWVGAFVKHPCPLGLSSSSFIPPVQVLRPSVDTRNCAVSKSPVCVASVRS